MKQIINTIKMILYGIKYVFKNNKIYFFINIFSNGILNLQVFLFAYLNKELLNNLVNSLIGKTELIKLIFIISIIIGCTFVFEVLSNAFNYLLNYSAIRLNDKLNLEFCKKVTNLDYSFFDSPNNNNNIKQVSTDLQSIISVYVNFISLFFSTISFLSALVISFKLDKVMTMISICITIPTFFIDNKIKNDDYLLEKELNQTVRRADYFKGLFLNQYYYKEFHLYNLKNYFTKKYLKQIKFKNNNKKKLLFLNFKRELLLSFVGFILNFVANVYLIYVIIINRLSVGDYQYYITMINNIKNCSDQMFAKISDINVESKRIENCVSFSKITPIIVSKANIIPSKNWKIIEFKNVSFCYPNSTKMVLNKVSFKFCNKEKIAFAGVNGAGKSTLINLLLRFYDPTEGEILLDGINIKDYNLDSYRDLFSTMFQNNITYELTIKENIAISNIEKRSETEKIKNALIDSYSNEFIKEEDLNKLLGKTFDENGLILSQGQAQKLCAAKTIFKKDSIYILDEPSASMDALSEYSIFKSFEKVAKNNCLILISHRLSNLINMDKIIFLKNGKILEQGSHEELFNNHLDYYKLFCMQADKYLKKNGKFNES